MMEFERFCRGIAKRLSWLTSREKINRSVSQEFLDALKFTGMNIEAYEIIVTSYFLAALSFLIILLLFIIYIFQNPFSTIAIMPVVAMVAIPLFVLHVVSEYPKIKARYMKIHCLGDVPEIISYIVMYLKLNPNLENAFRFAAMHSNTSLGNDLKKLIWDIEIRVYKSMDNAISYFAQLWGKWNEYFKRAIHLIQGSIHESNEGERNSTLDRSLDIVLDGTKSIMLDFSAKLHQPTLVIYSIGVMMPLAMVAMLPAISIVGFRISSMNIFIFYDIILPILLFLYIRKILLSRPAAFNPSPIPESHPMVKRINKTRNAMVAIASALLMGIVSFYSCKNAVCLAMAALWAVALPFSIYLLPTYSRYKKVRDGIRKMEGEFGDALYLLGKRLMEGRPLEEAFQYLGKVMGKSHIGEIFKKAHFNLISMKMSIDDSLFDKNHGALKHVYSDRIKAVLRMLVAGVRKSYEASGVAIIKIAEHFKQLQEVEKSIKNSLFSFSSSLRTTAMIFAPMIAGITLGITKLMANIFKRMGGDNAFFIMGNIKPEHFILIIGFYVILLVLLLIRLANGIDEGDDLIEYYYSVGKSLPIAMSIFSIVTILSMSFFQGMV